MALRRSERLAGGQGDAVDVLPRAAINSWFDPGLAERLWMPVAATLGTAARQDRGSGGAVAPLLTSWFEVSNFTDTHVLAAWHPPSPAVAPAAPAAAARPTHSKRKVPPARTKRPARKKPAPKKERAKGKKPKKPPRPPKLPPNSMWRVRLHPTTSQRAKLEHMFASGRAIFNKLVGRTRDACTPHLDDASGRWTTASVKELHTEYQCIRQASKLRRFFRKRRSRARLAAVNEEVRDSAFRDFLKAVTSSRACFFALKAKGKATTFPELKFKSKFARSDTLELRARSFISTDSGIRFHSTFFGFADTEGIAISKPLPSLRYSVRLQRLREGECNLLVPQRKEWARTRSQRVCAIDPGVRNFITVYDPAGRTMSVSNAYTALTPRFNAIDKAKSTLAALDNACKARHATKTRTKQRVRASRAAHTTAREPEAEPDRQQEELSARRRRYRLRRRIRLTNRRVTRMVGDMHHKVASWLAANYRAVLLPTFQTSDMVRRYEQVVAVDEAPPSSPDETFHPAAVAGVHQSASDALPQRGRRRTIRSPTARAMLSQAHYKLRTTLEQKMARVGGVVVLCGEEYTSKTCSSCGSLNHTLGGSSVYECPSCGGRFDRDVNAARNILIKNWSLLQ